MSEYEEDEGIECPMCGFTQTEIDKHEKGKWFCFLCGCIWNPETENYDDATDQWIHWDEEKECWLDANNDEFY